MLPQPDFPRPPVLAAPVRILLLEDDRTSAAIAKALKDPTVAERMKTLGLDIVADTPEQFARFVAAESEKMRRLVQASGARVD